MECITLAGLALLDPGDAVVVEAPTYLGALMAFAGFEAPVTGIPMDEDGLQVDVLEARLADGLRPKLIYLIPEFQNPTGRTLTLERRQALIELCRRHGVLILEDVAYREMSFDGGALPSLWSLGPDVVVQAGTFSKIFCPGVRLGWAVGPADVIAQMAAAKQTGDQCASALAQRIVEQYGRAGHFERQVPQSRALYERGWRAVEGALHEHMPPGVAWSEPSGGFFTWLDAARRARRERAAPGRARGRRELRARPPLLSRGRRSGRAARVVQLPVRGGARRPRSSGWPASSPHRPPRGDPDVRVVGEHAVDPEREELPDLRLEVADARRGTSDERSSSGRKLFSRRNVYGCTPQPRAVRVAHERRRRQRASRAASRGTM